MARTVLIADDSPTIQKRASGILKGEGIEVVTVSNGVAAIKKLPSVHPLVILADVAMPGKDGYEVCEHVKGTAEISHIPVLLIFSEDDPFDEKRGMQSRADGRIKKPFEQSELVTIVKRHLEQAEAAAKAAAQAAAAPAARAERPAVVTEPVDAEPEVGKSRGPDLSSFSGNMAFSATFGEEPAPPLPTPVSPDAVAPAEPFLEATPTGEQTPEAEAVPESAVGPELPAEPATVFHAPAEIPEAVISEEAMDLMPPPEAPTAAEALPEMPAAAEPEPVVPQAPAIEATAAPESNAAFAPLPTPEVQVESISPEPAAVAASDPEASPVPAQTSPKVDAELVYSIVHKTVVKMSPPALSPQMIEDMARRLAGEIAEELESSSSSS